MNIHEYQGKQLLRDYGVPVPKGRVAFTVEEALHTSQRLGSMVQVVKAQIHAGGRGKAGGVKIAYSLDEVRGYAESLLGAILTTHQTGNQGQKVSRLLIEEVCAIKEEYYVGLVLDRKTGQSVFMVSREGGMDIESVAATHPERIIKVPIQPNLGLTTFQVRVLAKALELPDETLAEGMEILRKLYDLYVDNDCIILEINPLVLTEEHKLLALDVKMNFDGNALYRNPHILAYRDVAGEDHREIEAEEHGLSYVALEGDIACMVNGAGLAMATMDILKHYGGCPANFLDVGGSATAEKVKEALKIICRDSKVKGLFINIFGGIMKCDVIAKGVVAAAEELKIDMPLIVRLEGTNVDKGKRILKQSMLNIITADSLADGAYKAVALTR
ncbi:MAG: ADP-forming succinate--CoA ligase subunit beta [Clostridia bacterium]|nr:ADP-forming succinate--CoA ligase subunit beta [Clostridia bacterium]